METWFTLEPRDGMLVRDGRAMNGTVGRSLAVPHPPTIAGLLRTRLGLDARGEFDKSKVSQLLEGVQTAGPLLARLKADGEAIDEVFGPAPGDCAWFGSEGAHQGHRLVLRAPNELVAGALTDLGADRPVLDLAGAPGFAKPLAGPRHWRWSHLERWLKTKAEVWKTPMDETGLREFEREIRTHIAIDGASSTTEDGALFMTESRRLVTLEGGGNKPRAFVRWALLARVTSSAFPAPQAGLVPLGGERRGAFLAAQTVTTLACPSEIRSLRQGDRARVLLLTPAIFAEGALPAQIRGARVLAGRVDRPETVSGWDFLARAPKPSRRMAPAGSVYWVEVPSADWATETWLSCVSSNEQDRRDGFGLAAVGVV